MDLRRNEGKGFLIGVSSSPICSGLEQHFRCKVRHEGAILLYDGNYSKNFLVEQTEHQVFIYKGDRHLYKSFSGQLESFNQQPVNELAGTLVNYSATHQTLEIKTDFLGSEPLYYSVIDKTLWVTDRIDNFSRFFNSSVDLQAVYTFLATGASVASRTVLNNIRQTTELMTLRFDNRSSSLTTHTSNHWGSEKDADTSLIKSSIHARLVDVLSDVPESALMLSAGWDSRVLLGNAKNIKCTYTHGDLSSREIGIAFQLGRSLQVPMNFLPLEESVYGSDANRTMLEANGQCLFPHWFKASQFLDSQNALPITSGMFVEHFSGHYGLNIIPGPGRKTRTIKSLLLPESYDKISKQEAVNILTPLLSSGFESLPWFFEDSVDFNQLQKDFRNDVNSCLQGYADNGTTGIHELCERYKMLQVERQYMANQTKSAGALSGYHHPYIDGKFTESVLKLKYRHRIGYKLSQEFVRLHNPALLSIPMAATLVPAKAPIVLQEASRFARISGEVMYKRLLRKIPKGLGWNNFQFLNQTRVFHEYVEELLHPIWDRKKMHQFIDTWTTSNREAYTLVVMLGRIATVDFQIKCN